MNNKIQPRLYSFIFLLDENFTNKAFEKISKKMKEKKDNDIQKEEFSRMIGFAVMPIGNEIHVFVACSGSKTFGEIELSKDNFFGADVVHNLLNDQNFLNSYTSNLSEGETFCAAQKILFYYQSKYKITSDFPKNFRMLEKWCNGGFKKINSDKYAHGEVVESCKKCAISIRKIKQFIDNL
jgi:hypothetical protein